MKKLIIFVCLIGVLYSNSIFKEISFDPFINSKKTNYSPEKYQGQNIVRYNLLMTQSLSMMIPCNTDLRAGDVITCEFPKISREDKNEIDTETSGKYLIKELVPDLNTTLILIGVKNIYQKTQIQKILKKFNVNDQDIKNISIKLKRKNLANIYSGRELNIIIKGDVDGSIEALSDSLMSLSTTSLIIKAKSFACINCLRGAPSPNS